MSFNFDITAIVIIVLSIGFGYGRGFYKQFKITLAILAPFIVVVFAKDALFGLIDGLGFVDSVVNVVAKILGYFTLATADDAKLLLVYTVLFIVTSIVVSIFVGFFAPSKRKDVVTFKSKASKFVAAGLGLVRGVCLALIALYLLKEITVVNFDSPVTSLLVKIATPIIGDLTV